MSDNNDNGKNIQQYCVDCNVPATNQILHDHDCAKDGKLGEQWTCPKCGQIVSRSCMTGDACDFWAE